jgi:hypothetical protein
MAFLTFEKDVTGHPANKDVMLRMMTLVTRPITVLAKLFGGHSQAWRPALRAPKAKGTGVTSPALKTSESI